MSLATDFYPIEKNFEIYLGLPEFSVEKQAFIHYPLSPQHGGAFDATGQFIPGSGLERGLPQRTHRIFGGGTIDIATSSERYIKEPHLYLGGLFAHFGHCLLETLARIWPLLTGEVDNNISLALIAYPDQDTAMLKAWLIALGFPQQKMTLVHNVCQFAELIIPEPAFMIRRFAFQGYAQQLRQAFLNAHPPIQQAQAKVIYLSRKKLATNVRLIIGEAYIEAYLRSSGASIVYPEELPLVEQIALFQTCDIVIGYIGSAFHPLLFCEKTITAVYLCVNPPISTYPMIDAMVGNQAMYFKNTISPKLNGFHYLNLHNEPVFPDFDSLFAFFTSIGLRGQQPEINYSSLIPQFMAAWLRNISETLCRTPVMSDLRASEIATIVEKNAQVIAGVLSIHD